MENTQYISYEWAQVYFFGVLIFSFIFAAIPFVLSKSLVQYEKSTPYECGVEPFGHFFQFVNVQFFLLAVLFLIFDLEIMFLMP
jgi:NADH-quinone oxidoreductase subunit A